METELIYNLTPDLLHKEQSSKIRLKMLQCNSEVEKGRKGRKEEGEMMIG